MSDKVSNAALAVQGETVVTKEEIAVLITARIFQYGESVQWGQGRAMMAQFEIEDIVFDCLTNPQLPPMPEGYTGSDVKRVMRAAISKFIENENAAPLPNKQVACAEQKSRRSNNPTPRRVLTVNEFYQLEERLKIAIQRFGIEEVKEAIKRLERADDRLHEIQRANLQNSSLLRDMRGPNRIRAQIL